MKTPEKTAPADKEGNGNVARGIKQAGIGAHGTIDKVADAARPAIDRMAKGAHHAVDEVADAANQAAKSLGAKGEQLKEAPARLVEYWGNHVRENPVISVGIAVAAGFLLSRLISSR